MWVCVGVGVDVLVWVWLWVCTPPPAPVSSSIPPRPPDPRALFRRAVLLPPGAAAILPVGRLHPDAGCPTDVPHRQGAVTSSTEACKGTGVRPKKAGVV